MKHDKLGKNAAFAKLKELKGKKNVVTIDEVDNVYEEVDEKEYSKRVQRRQEEDWIIDDGISKKSLQILHSYCVCFLLP